MSINKIQETASSLAQKIVGNKFISSSGIILATNLLNAACNYLLVVFVSYRISGQLSQWTALTGLITILSSPIVGANLELSRRVSALEKNGAGSGFDYFGFLKKLFWRQGSLILLAFSVVVLFGSILINNNDQVQIAIYWLVGLVLYAQLQSGTSTQFLIGLIETKKAGMAMIFNGVGRLLISILLINYGFGILSLPLGLITSFGLSLLTATWFISNLKEADKKYQQKLDENSNLQKNPKTNFHPLKELLTSSKTILSLSILSLVLYSTAIIAEAFFPPQTSDLYAVIFNFGQITHFGSTAFMSVFMAHASRSKNLLEYKLALGVSSTVSVCIGLVFWLFGPWVLLLFNRTQYVSFIPLILLYTLFILIYNGIFISTQLLLAKKAFVNLGPLIFGVISMLFAQLSVGWYFQNQQISGQVIDTTTTLSYFILTSLGFGIIIFLILISKILKLNRKTYSA